MTTVKKTEKKKHEHKHLNERSRLQVKYAEQVYPELLKDFKNPMQVPTLKKVVISMGLAEATKDKTSVTDCFRELALISGQKPIITKSRKAIANFKLRLDQDIGLKVTLRGKRMFDFFDRFVNIVCPRVRDFRGFNPKGFDGSGNYSCGLTEQVIFPEINPDDIKRSQGMNINFVTSAETDEDGRKLLKLLGLPFAAQ